MQKDTVDYKKFNADLQRHLMKCELEYRAKMLPKGSNVDWLAEHCGTPQEIADFLRWLGFKVARIVDEIDCAGVPIRWVETTSGIIVFPNEPNLIGLVAKAAK